MDVNTINIIALAYLGDSIYEVYIRESLIKKGIAKVEEFTNSSNPCLTIDLYNSEIKRFEKHYKTLKIQKGPAVPGSSNGISFSCVVTKKR